MSDDKQHPRTVIIQQLRRLGLSGADRDKAMAALASVIRAASLDASIDKAKAQLTEALDGDPAELRIKLHDVGWTLTSAWERALSETPVLQ